ncbi:MAG: tyrosine-type recombinase/integrase, partial [Faecalibacillus sp.]
VGYIKNNPINLVTIKGVDKSRNKEKVLLFDEFNQIIKDLENEDDFKYKAYSLAVQIGFYTGLRISEVLALEKSDFDLKNDLISINKKLFYKGLKKEDYYATEQMKSKKSKAIIPLAGILKLSLIKWFKINPYDRVICDIEGNYINPTVLTHDVKKIANKHGIEFNYHMLRHTFATNLITNDIDIKTTQELMRHSNFNTTLSLYTHINDEHKKEAINSVFGLKSVEKVSKIDKAKTLN